MIEVEAKIRVNSINDFRRKVKLLGKYKGKEKKADTYYTLEKLNHYPRRSLRIRKRKGKYEVNFKQKLSYVKGVHAKNEVEFVIDDVKDFLALIEEFGFKPWLKKEKVTELYEIKPGFHIEINKVRNLGWFIEVEYLCNEDEVEKAREEVMKVIRKLGANGKDIVKEGYTKLLWDKRLLL